MGSHLSPMGPHHAGDVAQGIILFSFGIATELVGLVVLAHHQQAVMKERK